MVTSKAVWLDAKDIGQSDSAPGKLLGGAQVTVKEREGDRLQLVLKGWQVEETPSVIYKARGQRVMMAVLDDAAADKVVRGKPEQDADTGLIFLQQKLSKIPMMLISPMNLLSQSC